MLKHILRSTVPVRAMLLTAIRISLFDELGLSFAPSTSGTDIDTPSEAHGALSSEESGPDTSEASGSQELVELTTCPFSRVQKRVKILECTREKFSGVVPQGVLDEMLPAIDGDLLYNGSKRSWETCLFRAREKFRGYVPESEQAATKKRTEGMGV